MGQTVSPAPRRASPVPPSALAAPAVSPCSAAPAPAPAPASAPAALAPPAARAVLTGLRGVGHRRLDATRVCVLAALALLVLAAAARPAHAQDTHERLTGLVAPTNRANAATWYFRAVVRAFELQSELDRIAAWDHTSLDEPPADVRAAVARCKTMFDQVHRGARADWCDWGFDRSAGFELVLPHLNPMRSITRALRADAVLRMNQGDGAGAAKVAATLDAMAMHAAQDDIYISSLIAMAIADVAEEVKQMGFARGVFTPDDARTMGRSLTRLPGFDPYRTSEAVIGEQMTFAEQMRTRYREPKQRADLALLLEWDASDETIDALTEISVADFDDAIRDYESIMDDAVEAFVMEDDDAARAAIEAVDAHVASGDTSLLTQAFMPSLGHILARRQAMDAQLAARLAMLQDIADGLADPAATVDASVSYRQAIEMVRMIEPWVVEGLVQGDAPPQADDDPARRAAWADGRTARAEVAALLARGAARPTFDAGMLRSLEHPVLLQPWVGGMRSCLQLLLSVVRDEIRAGDPAAARERLTVACHVIADLSSAESMLASRVAHEQFVRATSLGTRLAGQEAGAAAGRDEAMPPDAAALRDDAAALDAAAPRDAADALRQAVRSIGRSDPFGYVASTAQLRRSVVWSVMRLWERVEGEAVRARIGELDRPVRRSSGAGLFNLLLVLGVGPDEADAVDDHFAGDQPPPADAIAVPPGLAAFMDTTARDALLASGLAMRRSVVDRRRDVLATDAEPDPFGLVEATASARRDFMAGLAVLAPVPARPDPGAAPREVADDGTGASAGRDSVAGGTPRRE